MTLNGLFMGFCVVMWTVTLLTIVGYLYLLYRLRNHYEKYFDKGNKNRTVYNIFLMLAAVVPSFLLWRYEPQILADMFLFAYQYVNVVYWQNKGFVDNVFHENYFCIIMMVVIAIFSICGIIGIIKRKFV